MGGQQMSTATLIAACVLLLAKGALSGGHCNGMGRRFCADMATRAQHYAGKCPEPCRERNCRNRKSTELLRSGADRRGPDPKWEEIVFNGLYEHVYIHEKHMCVGSCWKEPWKSECENWETRFGKKYCKKLSCDHDKATRYSGCHRDPDGKRKLPWHKPTCKECAHVFPVACFNELKEYYDDDVREEISRRAIDETLELELNARKYCYLTYFGPVLGIDMPGDDSDDTTSTKQSEDESASRRLLSSSSESSGDSFDSVLKPDDVDRFRLMEKDGDLTCPPPQCMTKHDALLKPLVAPWYHVTKKGSCKWNGCNGRPMGNEWCQENVDSCISCRGTWCPPRTVPFWNPVITDNYQSRKPILPVADFTRVFPRAACNNDPLTDIRKADARALPWTDLAGDVMTPHFLERPLEPEDANQIEIVREKLEQDWLYGLPQKERREAIRRILDREKADNEALKQADEAAERAVNNYVKQQQQLVKQAEQQQSSPQGPAAKTQAAAKKRAAQRARELEESARAYCHLTYVNEAEAFGGQPGRQQKSSGFRSLLQGAASKSSLPQAMIRKFSKMQMLEQIRCPPAECYFADIEDQDNDNEAAGEDADDNDGNTSGAVEWSLRMQLPWYHRMDAGYCTWSPTCDGKTGVKGTYCSASAGNCVKRCSRGVWCPPFSFLNWDPVVSSNYTSLQKAMRALSGKNQETNNRNGFNAASAGYNTQAAQSGTSRATVTSFDFLSCQKKPVTGITLSAAEGLEWPGMIDITASAQKQAAGSP